MSWGGKTLTRRKIGRIIVHEYLMGHFTGVWFFLSLELLFLFLLGAKYWDLDGLRGFGTERLKGGIGWILERLYRIYAWEGNWKSDNH